MKLLMPHGVSIVLPVYNEQDCLDSVLRETLVTCAELSCAEIIAVNDGSTDNSKEILLQFARQHDALRVIDLDRNSGQSAAMWAGFQAARYDIIATIDADGQNDPHDIVTCIKTMDEHNADLCSGIRLERHDTWSKRIGSRFANAVRRSILNDGISDTGCPLKVYKTEFLKRLQYWNGMHRFLPALCMMQGAKVCQRVVSHRNRFAGKSKYSNWGRLKVTIRDLFGVLWLKSRMRGFTYTELSGEKQ